MIKKNVKKSGNSNVGCLMKKTNIANRLSFSLKYLLSYKKQMILEVLCYHGNFKNLKLVVMNVIKVISPIELNFIFWEMLNIQRLKKCCLFLEIRWGQYWHVHFDTFVDLYFFKSANLHIVYGKWKLQMTQAIFGDSFWRDDI